ncbi:TPA: hypothetical protein EYP13_03570, partial [Candidatus Micrarchaeota archaeon]|nr:hypothetical protein [Candidatus Micrarchaeota archaeon]
ALGMAKAQGLTRAGVIKTTFKEETETDLFAEPCAADKGYCSADRPRSQTSNSGYCFHGCVYNRCSADRAEKSYGCISEVQVRAGYLKLPQIIGDLVKPRGNRVLHLTSPPSFPSRPATLDGVILRPF